MHNDIKELIESRSSWKELNPEQEELVEVIPSVAVLVKNIKNNDPIMFEFMQLLVKAHNENNQEEKQTILAAMDYYKENK